MARKAATQAPATRTKEVCTKEVNTKAAKPTSTKPANTTVTPINPEAKTFFDLPGELRNQIYDELLPDADRVPATEYYARRGLRADGQKTSTSFMAACRMVYDEAASILYAPFEQGVHTILLQVNMMGTVEFLGTSMKLEDFNPAGLAALKRVKRLGIIVRTDRSHRYVSLCDVQDALFAVCSIFHADHKLQDVNARYLTPTTGDGLSSMFPSSYAGRMYESTVMQEFQHVHPGDVSRAHIAAFLTDPLRTIRGIKNGKKKGKLSLEFVGKSDKPWRELQGQVRSMVQGNTAVPDYKIFCAYFAILGQLERAVVGYVSPAHKVRLFKPVSHARIRGEVQTFREAHGDLVKSITNLAKELSNWTTTETYPRQEGDEEKCREMMNLCEELEQNLPEPGADTSFFGYNIADVGLREWQEHGRAAEKEAKVKRKRERSAKEEKSKKKARVEEVAKEVESGEEVDAGEEEGGQM